jgi:hypothetical protein
VEARAIAIYEFAFSPVVDERKEFLQHAMEFGKYTSSGILFDATVIVKLFVGTLIAAERHSTCRLIHTSPEMSFEGGSISQ